MPATILHLSKMSRVLDDTYFSCEVFGGGRSRVGIGAAKKKMQADVESTASRSAFFGRQTRILSGLQS